MDVNRWKSILFEWVRNNIFFIKFPVNSEFHNLQIKSSELIDVFGSLEHVQINDFFVQFQQILIKEPKKNCGKITISNFLQGKFCVHVFHCF